MSRQSQAARWSVGAVLVAALVTALFAGRRRQRTRSGAWLVDSARSIVGWRSRPPPLVAGVVGWALVIAAVVGWDLNSFVHQAHDLPTLSYYMGRVTRWAWGRGLVFAAWLAVGCYLVAGWRRQAGRP